MNIRLIPLPLLACYMCSHNSGLNCYFEKIFDEAVTYVEIVHSDFFSLRSVFQALLIFLLSSQVTICSFVGFAQGL